MHVVSDRTYTPLYTHTQTHKTLVPCCHTLCVDLLGADGLKWAPQAGYWLCVLWFLKVTKKNCVCDGDLVLMVWCNYATIMHCMSEAFFKATFLVTICCCVMCVWFMCELYLHVISLKIYFALKYNLFSHCNHKTNLFTYDYVRDCVITVFLIHKIIICMVCLLYVACLHCGFWDFMLVFEL